MINFPASPTLNQEFTSGSVTWRWNGVAWQIKPTVLSPLEIPDIDASKITSGVLSVARGGTGIGTYTTGNYLYASGTNTLAQRTPTQLRIDIGAAEAVHTHPASDIVSGVLGTARLGTGTANASTFLRGDGSWASIPGGGTVTSVSAGSGMNFTTITTSGPVTLGTPSSVTLSSTNNVTTNSHTHAFSPGGTTAQYIRGDGSLATFAHTHAISDVTGLQTALDGKVSSGSNAGLASLTINGGPYLYTSSNDFVIRTGINPSYSYFFFTAAGSFSTNGGTINCGTLNSGNISATGSISATGNVTGGASDRRLKRNLNVIEKASEKLLKINGYTYDWDTDLCTSVGYTPLYPTEHGLVAQEVQEIQPDAVIPAAFNPDYFALRYEKLVPITVAAINEHTKMLQMLLKEIEEIKQKLGY